MELFILIIVIIGFLTFLDSMSEPSKPRHYNKSPRLTKKPESDLANLFIFMSNKQGYLDSVEWNEGKRKPVLKRDKYTCQCCGITNVPLEVHHLRDYNKLGNEPLSSLISLCRSCHQFQHQTLGYPQTFKQYMDWNVPLIKRN